MPVFAGFGSRFGNGLARLVLDEDVVAFCEGRGLGGGGEGGICGGRGEIVIMNGGHFFIGCFADTAIRGGRVRLVKKNVDECLTRISCGRQRSVGQGCV